MVQLVLLDQRLVPAPRIADRQVEKYLRLVFLRPMRQKVASALVAEFLGVSILAAGWSLFETGLATNPIDAMSSNPWGVVVAAGASGAACYVALCLLASSVSPVSGVTFLTRYFQAEGHRTSHAGLVERALGASGVSGGELHSYFRDYAAEMNLDIASRASWEKVDREIRRQLSDGGGKHAQYVIGMAKWSVGLASLGLGALGFVCWLVAASYLVAGNK